MPIPKIKTYLGDSVYADFDGFHIVLTTDNGLGPSNTIMLDPEIYAALTRFVGDLTARRQREAHTEAMATTDS